MPNLPFVIADAAPSPERVGAGTFGGDRGLGMLGQVLQRSGSLIAEVNDRVFTAEQESIGRSALASAATELTDFENDLQNDPDYDTHEQRYQAKVQELAKRSTGLRGPFAGEFSGQLASVGQGGLGRIRGDVRTKRNDRRHAEGIAQRQQFTDLAAQAKTPEDRDFYRGQIAESLKSEISNGMTATQAVTEALSVEKEIASADLREAVTLAPKQAFADLLNPNSALSKSTTEAERQIWLGRAKTAAERDIRAQYTAEKRSRALAKESAKADNEVAVNELLAMAQPGDVGVTMEAVQERWDDLSVSEKIRFTEIAQRGGRLPHGASDNPDLVNELTARAEAGEPITGLASDGIADGHLTIGTFQILNNRSRDVRFKSAREWLNGAIRPENGLFGGESPGSIRARADATLALDTWIQKNPEADVLAATTAARAIAEVSLSQARGRTALTPQQTVVEGRKAADQRSRTRLRIPPGTPITPELRKRMNDDPVLILELQNLKLYESLLVGVGK
jgi:hypothetical protein